MMRERKRKGILEEEAGSTEDLDLYLILPSLPRPPFAHFFSFICLMHVDAKNSKTKG